jgi:hypothetical protein
VRWSVLGAKTATTLLLAIGAAALALARGALLVEQLPRGPSTLFVVGGLGAVVGTLMFRFWRLHEPSRYVLRAHLGAEPRGSKDAEFLAAGRLRVTVGEARGDAFDLPPRAQHALCVAIALLLALGSFDPRALALIARFHQRIAWEGAGCPEGPAAPISQAIDPNAPGCALIRRAVALGYAESLGDCAPRAPAAAPCERRLEDEPFLHHAWRLLDGFVGRARAAAAAGWVGKARRDYRDRAAHLGALGAVEEEVLTSAPRASHHIWTNLPDPQNGAFAPRGCADRYRWLSHRPAPSSSGARDSEVFEHVVAQLLFEGRYEPAAGACREYHVHWGAPLDACQRLAAAPEAFLQRSGALSPIRAVLSRARVDDELAPLRARRPPPALSAVISFHCYIQADAPSRRTVAFALNGLGFTAEEVRVPPSPRGDLYVDRYPAIAGLLARGFHYGRLLSEAGLADGDTLADRFDDDDFLVTRLFELDSVDLYLGPGWLAARPDLLEVYPYQRHLKSFVQAFRRQYRQGRARL